MKPALVVLAAGASSRLGRCKALVEVNGRTVLAAHLEAGVGCDETPPLVITGKHHAEILARAPRFCEVLFNAWWADGRTGGVLLARDARPGRALLIAPADVPFVPREVFDLLLDSWARAGAPDRGWLAPRFSGRESEGGGRHGHPVVLGPGLLEDLSGMSPDSSLRTLREAAEPLLSVETTRPEILRDLDTPEDLAALERESP